MKICRGCNLEKGDYPKNPKLKTGFSYYCRDCTRERKRNYRKTDRGKATEQRYIKSDKGRAKAKRSYDKHYRLRPHRREKILICTLKRMYGITLEYFKKMFDEQGGKCSICCKHQSEFKKRLSVDHNHKTKKIRSLLCQHCNQGLGHFREDINLLNEAINYLKKHEGV